MSEDLVDLDELLDGVIDATPENRIPTLAEAQDPLTWARDVILVKNCGDTLEVEGYIPTASQRQLHKWACDPINTKEFMKTMVPAAAKALEKANSTTADEIEKHEIRGIKELERDLQEYLDDFQQQNQVVKPKMDLDALPK